jgi:hypothetical protein
MKFSASFLMISLSLMAGHTHAQNTVDSPDELLGQTKAITTAVPFLAISPDARHAALGDAGVASSPDANASYWNPAKLTFIDKHYGGSISYTPWLGKIINDMSISYLTLFYKIGREQAISGSLKYFDLGDIFFTENGVDGTNFNPREYAVDLTYSRKLTEEFSVGLTGRYIHSNLTGAFSSGGVDAQPGKSVAVDLGVFYTKQLQSAKSSNLSLGASISNIGAKISYSDSNNEDFLPTNLRLGGAFTTELDPYNSITFLLDFNKLMVPTVDEGQSVLDGMFSSFTDAPGGFSEEIHEIMTSMGVEYWYHEVFAARLGYFLEAYEKGNRKYLTLGAGFRKNNFGFDMAYLVPTNKREHPLAETLRFTLLFQINNDQTELDNSVTE